MADQLYSLSFKEILGLLGACGAVIVSTTGAVWKLMNRQVTHWKEMYEAKVGELADSRKENEQIKAYPKEFAMNLISQADAVMSSQIKKLKEAVEALKAECAAKDEEIRNLTNAAQASDEKLIYAQEEKEKLERKVKAYDEIMQLLIRRRDRARESLFAFKKGDFEVDKLSANIEEEIRKRMVDIDASSFSKTSSIEHERALQASRQAEMRTSLEFKKKSAEIKHAEDQVRLRAEADIPRPKPPVGGHRHK